MFNLNTVDGFMAITRFLKSEKLKIRLGKIVSKYIVAHQLPEELAADSDDEEIGEELRPVLKSREGSDGYSALDTDRPTFPSHQKPPAFGG